MVKGQGIYAFVTLVEGVPYSEELHWGFCSTGQNTLGTGFAKDEKRKDNEENPEKDCFKAIRRAWRY
ncbi:unnamed protein product [Arabis nemorensis]|uniref:Uncharacterized protein n=1 Tax=Arabis nemorensis TaxID=586526 RepID=A0A565CTA7_9BRAS|nr:unnamed protein product [Arabis nemorensis]